MAKFRRQGHSEIFIDHRKLEQQKQVAKLERTMQREFDRKKEEMRTQFDNYVKKV
jgi:hypothetical protein